ncbi:hypothetical protein GCM10010885_11140 [Alicyclobacillus cellulosilyticus]|uniref:ABC transporter domain-containing protein n=1 Tax=Alicyclobacillus cellulosilyticus TaxID=1003997 RepID=A0A917KA94_9BACL|nr:ABC transporter ATP-binding protein [Alicyclobacillus cellulosilyticus]GGJ03633.1 hypothetical protein GCM10010885_11140 [Alicyclobacillus cellulosilyticus]
MPELRMEGVSFHNVLRDITVAWSGGSLIGLIGPNGAGKSTLMRLAAGIWVPTGGRVTLDSRDVHRLNPLQRARHLTYLPQQTFHDVAYTVREFVAMGRFAHRKHWQERVHALRAAGRRAAVQGRGPGGASGTSRQLVEDAIAAMELAPLADVPLAQLSGGERQRAAIARCLAQGCDTWLLDEPISNLDPYYQWDILRRLRAMAEDGRLIVIAIHHLELAAQFCTELTLLHHRTVFAHGSPEEVLREDVLAAAFRLPIRTFRDPHTGVLRVSLPPRPAR